MQDLDIRVADEPIGEGQYLLVSTHAWWLESQAFLAGRRGTPEVRYASLAEQRIDRWIPADPAADWLMDRSRTGRRIWVRGSEEQALADGVDLGQRPDIDGRFRAPHGDFYAHLNGESPRPREGSWQCPDPPFLAGLPREVDGMLHRLHQVGPATHASRPFTCATDLLRSGQVPAELRTVLYLALLQVEGVEFVDEVTDLDGRGCRGFRLPGDDHLQDLLVDPDNGHYAGARTVHTAGSDSVPPGTISQSSVITAVVDDLGQIPDELASQYRTGTP